MFNLIAEFLEIPLQVSFLMMFIGVFLGALAMWRSRTPQGAAAWIIALLSVPLLAVPLFMIFGRKRFFGYVRLRRELDSEAQKELSELQWLSETEVSPRKGFISTAALATFAGQPGFTGKNRTQLLINAEQTYASMFEAVEKAKKYVLIQFYIFRTDEIGTRFIDLLKKKAREGVRIYFLCDALGTFLNPLLVRELRRAGIEVANFRSSKWGVARFQLNFRNHRKVLVVDSEVAFLGGLNVGDDYLGKDPNIGPWRDTHLRIEGPGAVAAQLSFVKDWYWVKERIPDLDWRPKTYEDGAELLVLHTSAADDAETCLLTHIALVNASTKRLWIANPYLIPPEGLLNAIELAALRGVEVRILTPSYSDNRLVLHASRCYKRRLAKSGIRIFEYLPGFVHQKVILVDEKAALVGSANMDFRSMFINFEISAISHDSQLIKDVEKMLENDFQNSRELSREELLHPPLRKEILARAANLLSPIL